MRRSTRIQRPPGEPRIAQVAGGSPVANGGVPGWLSETEWRQAQASLPISCVDILPVQVSGRRVHAIGLILRDTPHEARRWCLIGGRLGHNESLGEAVARQLREALGTDIRVSVGDDPQPTYTVQYFSSRRAGRAFDPRQHALGMTFCLPVDGKAVAQGEALAFEWFDRGEFPSASEVGFGQRPILDACVSRFEADSSTL